MILKVFEFEPSGNDRIVEIYGTQKIPYDDDAWIANRNVENVTQLLFLLLSTQALKLTVFACLKPQKISRSVLNGD